MRTGILVAPHIWLNLLLRCYWALNEQSCTCSSSICHTTSFQETGMSHQSKRIKYMHFAMPTSRRRRNFNFTYNEQSPGTSGAFTFTARQKREGLLLYALLIAVLSMHRCWSVTYFARNLRRSRRNHIKTREQPISKHAAGQSGRQHRKPVPFILGGCVLHRWCWCCTVVQRQQRQKRRKSNPWMHLRVYITMCSTTIHTANFSIASESHKPCKP